MCELNLVKNLNFWFGGHGSIRFRYNRGKNLLCSVLGMGR